MKSYVFATLTAALLATGAQAQTHGDSHNPAVKDRTPHTAAVAAKGRNSFTESQARGRIAKAGYANVSKLAKNRNGVWQGIASRRGKRVAVALDYKGNVTVY